MKLIPRRYASPHEIDHVYPRQDARALVADSLSSGYPIDGMDHLRSDLMSQRHDDALAEIDSGEWLLVKDDAYFFDWGRFEKSAQQQKAAYRANEASSKPVPEKPVEKFIVRILDSISGEPLANRKVRFVMGQQSSLRKTDNLGVAYLSPAPPPHVLATLQLYLAD